MPNAETDAPRAHYIYQLCHLVLSKLSIVSVRSAENVDVKYRIFAVQLEGIRPLPGCCLASHACCRSFVGLLIWRVYRAI